MLRYQEMVTSVARKVAVPADDARIAVQATVAALAHSVDGHDRARLLAAMPAAVRDVAEVAPGKAVTVDAFVSEVSWLAGVRREQSRYRAQAVLSTIAEQEPGLLPSLDIPSDLRALSVDPAPGGGIIGPTGGTAPLTITQVRGALAELPYWGGDQQALWRSLTLPTANLDRVLVWIERLRRDLGRGPGITRDGDTATLRVHTDSVDAVTALDVDLAHRIDATISAAGAGISG